MIDYAVGIPTRGRTDILFKTIGAFKEQTHPPQLILVIDNNDKYGLLEKDERFGGTEKTKVASVKCDYDTLGIIHGDQTALRVFTQLRYKIAVRWDDDLVPEKDCLEELIHHVTCMGVPAAGGMYPGPGGKSLEMGNGFSHMEGGKLITGNGNPRHLQFFRWRGENRCLRRSYLYSSFVYSVQKANLIGGFCPEYSQHSFRADTDFTLRLNELGPNESNLVVDTSARATHYFESGGTRDIRGKEKIDMKQHDLALFDWRMRSMGIDPEY